MDLPIKFPSDADVIAEEAARFRALSPEDRMRSIRGLLTAGELLMRRSPNPTFLRAYTLEQEERAQQAIKDFIARHATAECLILTKMAAFQPQDQADIETLLSANRGSIDVGVIRNEWSAVADGEDARTAWLEAAIARLVPPRPASPR